MLRWYRAHCSWRLWVRLFVVTGCGAVALLLSSGCGSGNGRSGERAAQTTGISGDLSLGDCEPDSQGRCRIDIQVANLSAPAGWSFLLKKGTVGHGVQNGPYVDTKGHVGKVYELIAYGAGPSVTVDRVVAERAGSGGAPGRVTGTLAGSWVCAEPRQGWGPHAGSGECWGHLVWAVEGPAGAQYRIVTQMRAWQHLTQESTGHVRVEQLWFFPQAQLTFVLQHQQNNNTWRDLAAAVVKVPSGPGESQDPPGGPDQPPVPPIEVGEPEMPSCDMTVTAVGHDHWGRLAESHASITVSWRSRNVHQGDKKGTCWYTVNGVKQGYPNQPVDCDHAGVTFGAGSWVGKTGETTLGLYVRSADGQRDGYCTGKPFRIYPD